MVTRRQYRPLLLGVLILMFLPFALGMVTGTDVQDRYEAATGAVAEERDNITVVTTSPRADTDASIIAVGGSGEVLYYEESRDRFFDVDPLPGTKATVEYVRQVSVDDCPPLTEVCGAVNIERVNVTTGEKTVVYSWLEERRNGWHDFDRIGPHRLLVADISNRIFVVNTTTGLITWQYEFRTDYNRSNGGAFPQDWTHLNDVEYLGNGTVMASPRNFDQVVFIDMRRGLNESRTLGTDGDHSTLYEQHNPDYIPASRGGPAVIVGDSENNRVVEYERTESGEWKRTWIWRDRQMQWPRDADRLPNGHTLITDSNGNRVFEVDRDGEIVWSIPVETPYEAERLGTGSESSGGAAATALELDNRTVSTTSDSEGEASYTLADRIEITLGSILLSIKSALPNPVTNGLLFVLPGWAGAFEVGSLVGTVFVGVVWVSVELWISPWSIRAPLYRRDSSREAGDDESDVEAGDDESDVEADDDESDVEADDDESE